MSKEALPSNFSLSVFSMQGQKVMVDVQGETSIEFIRDEAVKKFSGIRGSGFDSTSEYTLVSAIGPCHRLSNKNTIKGENMTGSDVLLLYKLPSPTDKSPEISPKSIPAMPGIRKATEGLTTRGKPSRVESPVSQSSSGGSLENTFRKILLTLLDLSYKLMFFDEDADGVFSSNRKKNMIDPSLISPLTAMGFSEARACKALRLSQMDLEAAMEWLLHNPEAGKDVEMDQRQETDDSDQDDEDRHSAKRVKRRLEKWQKKSKTLEPSKDHIAMLTAMGFSQEESVQALKINGNDPTTACDWLLGDRKVPTDDPNDSLSPESELYKAIINDPTIHIGLHNKRVLEALEDMLENPLRRHNWANDSTVGSVILQILKLYHKYSNAGS